MLIYGVELRGVRSEEREAGASAEELGEKATVVGVGAEGGGQFKAPLFAGPRLGSSVAIHAMRWGVMTRE